MTKNTGTDMETSEPGDTPLSESLLPVFSLRSETTWLYLKLSLALSALFVTLYGGSNWLGSLRENHYRLYFSWELQLPFVPEMILVYLSIQLVFLLPLLHCNRTAMITLAKQMALATVIAAVIFVLFPAQLGFSRTQPPDTLSWLYSTLYLLDKPHNLFPSLHITLCSLVMAALWRRISTPLRIFYAVWLLALYASVILVRQHHLPDVAGGMALTWLCLRLAPNKKPVNH